MLLDEDVRHLEELAKSHDKFSVSAVIGKYARDKETPKRSREQFTHGMMRPPSTSTTFSSAYVSSYMVDQARQTFIKAISNLDRSRMTAFRCLLQLSKWAPEQLQSIHNSVVPPVSTQVAEEQKKHMSISFG